MPRLPGFRFRRPQQLAALLLLMLLAQGLWVLRHQTLTETDYNFARCGREIWERANPLARYFTSCGSIGDGTLAYRAAGLPLTLQRIFAGQAEETSTWEMRHQLRYVLLLLHSAFLLTGIALGAALWWVTRRLYGNTGGFIALALYCFSPSVIRACSYPNNEILVAFGLFAAIYTGIGVAHAMQGPPRKWRSRIVVLTLALGFTATSHVAAFILAFSLAVLFMVYLAVGRHAYILPIMTIALAGTLLLVFASYSFRPDAFSFFFRSGAERIWFSLDEAGRWFVNLQNAATAIAAAVALFLYISFRRSRYFGNTSALLVAILLFSVITPGVSSRPTLWALPFLLAFIAGTFADILETPQRRVFLVVIGFLLALQALLSLASLPGLAA